MESTPNEKVDARRIKKNAVRRQRHKLTKEMEAKIDVLSLMGKRKREQKDDEDEDGANETNTSLAEVIWDNMTPLSKKRTKLSMESCELPPNTKRQARKDLGINFSNTVDIRCEKMTSLQERIENRDDISRVCPCPDCEKVATNPTNALERKPIRYQLGHSKLLHAKFMAEDGECGIRTFNKYIPYYVRKPSATDWGTSLCGTCLNPQIKLERLVATKKLESQIVAEKVVSNQMQFDELLLKLNIIGDNAKKDDVTQFSEWTKVPNPFWKKGMKISRKLTIVLGLNKFIQNLIKELKIMKDHLHRAHMQYRAFKAAREDAMQNESSRYKLTGRKMPNLLKHEKKKVHTIMTLKCHCMPCIPGVLQETNLS